MKQPRFQALTKAMFVAGSWPQNREHTEVRLLVDANNFSVTFAMLSPENIQNGGRSGSE
jgi:hypothetical protein